MIKKIVFSLLFFLTIQIYSQNQKINNYKYVLVPDRFEFVKKSDQYQTSSLTKFLLKKKGFTVFLSNEKLPNELLTNRCMAITASVNDESSMFTVKQNITLKDCFGNILYTSGIGKSKAKEFKKAYHEAIRKAYGTMSELEYKYEPLVKEIKKTAITEPVKKEIPVKVIIPKVTKEVVTEKKEINTKIEETSINLEILYAQSKPNGFQLVNTSPAIVFQILKTKVKDVYIIKGMNGIIYKNNNSWTAEYYENDTLITKKYTIKF